MYYIQQQQQQQKRQQKYLYQVLNKSVKYEYKIVKVHLRATKKKLNNNGDYNCNFISIKEKNKQQQQEQQCSSCSSSSSSCSRNTINSSKQQQ